MKKFWLIGIPVVLLLVLLALAACTSTGTTPSPTASSTTTATTTSPAGPTAGGLASSGQSVFASHCARCHGDKGQGITAPAIIGSGQALAKYNTAQGLLSFISTTMPANAPGSLSSQQYLEVMAYLLLQNGFVTSGQALDNLGGISLK